MFNLPRATARFANGRGAVALFVALAFAACQTAPVSNVNTNAPQSSASPQPPAGANNAGASGQPVTLAVLDARGLDGA